MHSIIMALPGKSGCVADSQYVTYFGQTRMLNTSGLRVLLGNGGRRETKGV